MAEHLERMEDRWTPIPFHVCNQQVKEMEENNITDGRIKGKEVKLNLPLCLTKHHAMKTYWGVEV
jgi:chloramphenicol O-acetyltransferase